VATSTTHVFDPSAPWSLSEQVSLRDETFGALAYHHGNRRLVFLKSPELVALVRRLDEFESLDDAVEALAPPHERVRYTKALQSLHRSGILRGR
jgi:putative mycofactocin binding protein MftB